MVSFYTGYYVIDHGESEYDKIKFPALLVSKIFSVLAPSSGLIKKLTSDSLFGRQESL